MSKIVIGITTVRRKNEFRYLEQMLSGLENSGIFDNDIFTVVVSESGSLKESEKENFLNNFKDKVQILFSEERICANQNVSKVINYACSLNSDYIMYMNDDSIIHHSFSEKILPFIKKYQDYPCWVFYCPYYFHIIPLFEEGIDIYKYKYKHYYGSLCWVMRNNDAKKYAKELLKYYMSGSHIRKEIDKTHKTKGGDLLLGNYLKENYPNNYIAAHVPSLVDHQGKISTLTNTYAKEGYYTESKNYYLNDIEVMK